MSHVTTGSRIPAQPRRSALQTLRAVWTLPGTRRLTLGLGMVYLTLFLVALQDITRGGRGWAFLTTEWTRMWERTGPFTFEPIAQLTLPGLTVLLSPLNMAMGGVLGLLAGLNLAVTWLAFRQPHACRFNRSTGIVAGIPALLAGGACCAPAIILILGLQLSSLMVSVFQLLIPASLLLLILTLKLILDRTDPLAIDTAQEGG